MIEKQKIEKLIKEYERALSDTEATIMLYFPNTPMDNKDYHHKGKHEAMANSYRLIINDLKKLIGKRGKPKMTIIKKNETMEKGIDYRKLLIRYMRYIKHQEGRDYVEYIEGEASGFDSEEIDELKKLSEKMDTLDKWANNQR